MVCGTRTLGIALLGGSLLLPSALAHADTLKDNFGSNNGSLSLGTIAPGGSASGSINLTVDCSGNRHGAGTLEFSVKKALQTGPTDSLSEATATPSVVLPSTWPADGDGCGAGNELNQSGSAQIAVTVPADASAGERSIKFTVESTDPDVTNPVVFFVDYTVSGGSTTPVDATAPAAPTIDLAAASDSGLSSTDDVTNDNTPTLQGTAEAGSTVTVYAGSTLLGTAQADPAGSWSLTVLDKLSDGVHSLTATATDAANNTSPPSSALSVRVDKVAPTVDPADVNDTTWRNSSLSQDFTASEPAPASGLADKSDDAFTLTASRESEKAGADAVPTSVSRTVSDVAGNSTRRTLSALIDLTKPDLGVVDTNAAVYDVCASARPAEPTFNPTDALSGINTDPAKTGKTWSTSVLPSGVGSYSFAARAADVAGNSDTYGPKTYRVQYAAGGTDAFGGFLQPINATGPSSRFKLGSTIPVKFTATCNGVPLSNVVAKMYVAQGDSAPDPGIDEAVSTAAATTGNLFRYDATAGQYIFNLSTKSGYLNPGSTTAVAFSPGTWTLKVGLDDGTWRSVVVQLVK